MIWAVMPTLVAEMAEDCSLSNVISLLEKISIEPLNLNRFAHCCGSYCHGSSGSLADHPRSVSTKFVVSTEAAFRPLSFLEQMNWAEMC